MFLIDSVSCSDRFEDWGSGTQPFALMLKDNEAVTVGVLREMFAENNAILLKRFDQVDRRFEQVDQRFEQVDKRFEQIDQRFKQIDQRFEQVDQRFAQVDGRLDGLESKIDTEFSRVHREIDNLRDDIVDVLDRSIIPQLEDHRRDIALLKRVVVPA